MSRNVVFDSYIYFRQLKGRLMKHILIANYLNIILILYGLFSGGNVHAQNASLNVGLRFQQTFDLYNENGITVQYANPKWMKNHLQTGISYISTRLGSAVGRNAIKQDHLFLTGSYLFRPEKVLRPMLSVNAGWFHADYESPIFQDLPQSSATVALEAGVSVKTNSPLRFGAALGYNLITGDGASGPGTLYPVYVQLNITYNIFKTRAK
ncbi:hypothetical protein [Dyadobacter sandarakinus]|uniref:Outer membrane protein beta-barrel domain-containing protein n=1 Tax=Dyadobacter sandarakinus TaxID=2747268 RepID=A0ABX7I296_9BACT|nr:hypothetical protein [Dyadobacter sandarakinus]QRR00174.1 hypothetical protein HWI92_04280 [Dyadobacter sandarakinus]